MGDRNQELFMARREVRPERVLEVGSKDYGSAVQWRKIIPCREYVGIDLEAGNGVDVVQNLEDGVGELGEESFDLAICASVMEHTPRPWIFAENLTRLIKPEGYVYIAVPWVWRFHGYPNDYYRYTAEAIKHLFPRVTWSEFLYSTTIDGEFKEVVFGADDAMNIMRGNRKHLPYLQLHCWGRRD